MKLNNGDYARTYDGIIFKIQEIKDIDVYYSCNPIELQWQKQTFCILENKNEAQPVSQIKNSSSNIIDLIEVGDYVNGMRVKNVNDIAGFVIVNTSSISENTIFSYNIKSIVTKEMYSSMEYKVGE